MLQARPLKEMQLSPEHPELAATVIKSPQHCTESWISYLRAKNEVGRTQNEEGSSELPSVLRKKHKGILCSCSPVLIVAEGAAQELRLFFVLR